MEPFNFFQKQINTDQPGRIIAVFIISPILLYKSHKYKDWFIFIFSIILFSWDLYWLVCEPPKKCNNNNKMLLAPVTAS